VWARRAFGFAWGRPRPAEQHIPLVGGVSRRREKPSFPVPRPATRNPEPFPCPPNTEHPTPPPSRPPSTLKMRAPPEKGGPNLENLGKKLLAPREIQDLRRTCVAQRAKPGRAKLLLSRGGHGEAARTEPRPPTTSLRNRSHSASPSPEAGGHGKRAQPRSFVPQHLTPNTQNIPLPPYQTHTVQRCASSSGAYAVAEQLKYCRKRHLGHGAAT